MKFVETKVEIDVTLKFKIYLKRNKNSKKILNSAFFLLNDFNISIL